MKVTNISLIIAIIIGVVLYFSLSSVDFFVYYSIPAIIAVNGIRIIEKKKKGKYA
ncbi:hypothetical protein ACFC90_16725 [Enterococcus casseliflavus]|uniref:hypothetical protein n=1 Tax=Enterococcus casseliflavus TaxID=37734 RepID=UPI0039A57B25